MLVSIVTPSRTRPECVELCRAWYEHQDYDGEIEHIISDDDVSKPVNLERGIMRTRGDVILLWDDDDYYAPSYVRWMVENGAAECELFGCGWDRMYHVPKAGWQLRQKFRRPLEPTMGFRRDELIRDTLVMCRNRKPLKNLFSTKSFKRVPILDEKGRPIMVPMKGMPGTERNGLSVKHDFLAARYPKIDPDRSVLREWVGEEAFARYWAVIQKHGWDELR